MDRSDTYRTGLFEKNRFVLLMRVFGLKSYKSHFLWKNNTSFNNFYDSLKAQCSDEVVRLLRSNYESFTENPVLLIDRLSDCLRGQSFDFNAFFVIIDLLNFHLFAVIYEDYNSMVKTEFCVFYSVIKISPELLNDPAVHALFLFNAIRYVASFGRGDFFKGGEIQEWLTEITGIIVSYYLV